MQIFGLISLLVVIAIGAVWMTSSMGGTKTGLDGQTETTYKEAIDSARDAVDVIEKKQTVPTSGKSVTIYDGITVPDNTTVLDLSGRDLSGSLKAEIRHLSNLKTLDLSDNDFTGLPAEVGQLSQLEVLNLSNNPFTGLPYELGNLKNLKTLDLRRTNYAEQDLDTIKRGLPASVQILTD